MRKAGLMLLALVAGCTGEREAEIDWEAMARAGERGADSGDRRPETGDRSPDSGEHRLPEPGDRLPEPGDRLPDSGDPLPEPGPRPPAAARDPALDFRPPGARYSESFASDYKAQLAADLRELERSIAARAAAQPAGAPPSAKEKMLRARDEADRRRLNARPYLSRITDEEIADFLSYNPQLASGEAELSRLVADHGDSIPICADHARWLSARGALEPASVEFRRCMTLPGVSEAQMRYFNLQITALQHEMHPGK